MYPGTLGILGLGMGIPTPIGIPVVLTPGAPPLFGIKTTLGVKSFWWFSIRARSFVFPESTPLAPTLGRIKSRFKGTSRRIS